MKLGAQTQHRVIQRFVPPSGSKQSEITCARDKCVILSNIDQAISGSTVEETGGKLEVLFGAPRIMEQPRHHRSSARYIHDPITQGYRSGGGL